MWNILAWLIVFWQDGPSMSKQLFIHYGVETEPPLITDQSSYLENPHTCLSSRRSSRLKTLNHLSNPCIFQSSMSSLLINFRGFQSMIRLLSDRVHIVCQRKLTTILGDQFTIRQTKPRRFIHDRILPPVCFRLMMNVIDMTSLNSLDFKHES